MTLSIMPYEKNLGQEIAPVVQAARDMAIESLEHIKGANEMRLLIKAMMGKVEETLGEPKDSAYKTWKLMVSKEKGFLQPLQEAYDLIGSRMGAVIQAEQVKQAALARQAEDDARKRRDAEAARIEKKMATLLKKASGIERQIEALHVALETAETDGEAGRLRLELSNLIAQRDRAAVNIAAQAERQQVEAATPLIVFAPPVMPKVAGMSVRTRKKAEEWNKTSLIQAVANGALPVDLLDVNMTCLNKLVAAGITIAGVTVREVPDIASKQTYV